jgi:hypothetical protein
MSHRICFRSFIPSMLTLLTPLALGACSGASTTHGSNGSGTTAPAASNSNSNQVVWLRGTGTFDAKTGKFTLTTDETNTPSSASSSAAAGSVSPDSFGVTTRGNNVLQITNGTNSGGIVTCGDASQNITPQPNSFCAPLTITNHSNDNFDLVWIQIDTVTPTGITVASSQNGTDTIPAALTAQVNQTIGALNFGNIAGNLATSTRTFVFQNVTQNFTFTWSMLAADSHTTYSGTFANRVAFVDACTLTQWTNSPYVTAADNFTPVSNQDLPFPITIFNVTGVAFSLSSQGVFSLDPNFENGGAPNAANVTLPASGESSGTIFPFWTAQITRFGTTAGGTDTDGTSGGLSAGSGLSGQVCAALEGSTVGSRIFDVTWENMRACADASGCATPSDQNTLYSYTVRFFEGNVSVPNQDVIELQWDVMEDGATWMTEPPTVGVGGNETLSNRSRGANSTIGMQGQTSGATCGTVSANSNHCMLVTFDAASATALPNSVLAYPHQLKLTPQTSNSPLK